MDEPGTRCFEFGGFRLDPVQRLLFRGERRVPLTPKAVETLLALVESRGAVVSKEALLERVWRGTFVEDATVVQNVFTLRKALGRANDRRGWIETIPRRGYRFVAPVELAAWPAPPSGNARPMHLRWLGLAAALAAVAALLVLFMVKRGASRTRSSPRKPASPRHSVLAFRPRPSVPAAAGFGRPLGAGRDLRQN